MKMKKKNPISRNGNITDENLEIVKNKNRMIDKVIGIRTTKNKRNTTHKTIN